MACTIIFYTASVFRLTRINCISMVFLWTAKKYSLYWNYCRVKKLDCKLDSSDLNSGSKWDEQLVLDKRIWSNALLKRGSEWVSEVSFSLYRTVWWLVLFSYQFCCFTTSYQVHLHYYQICTLSFSWRWTGSGFIGYFYLGIV